MGCSISKSQKRAVLNDQDYLINKQLQEAKEKENLSFKILLLGAGESGKSTFSKQLRLISKQVITDREKENFTVALRYNVLDSIAIVLDAMKDLGIELADKRLSDSADRLCEKRDGKLTPRLAKDATLVWKDAGVQKAWSQREKFYFLDATPYYMAEAERIADFDFQVTEEDMIMSRMITTGIKEVSIPDDPFEFSVVDVGGQRNERKKWIHIFDNVKAIVFVVNLAGYNQVMFEDHEKNRMVESLELFEQVVSNPLFSSTNVFLLLNKKDLFEEEIKRTSLRTCFQDFKGEDGNVTEAISFIEGKFRKVMAASCPGKPLNTCVMAARVRMECRQGWKDIVQVIKSAQNRSCKFSLTKTTFR